MHNEPHSIFSNGEAGGPSFPDVSLQNERAMWWAEFDSVGEDAVRGYVQRKAYTPTGMEVARQWLAERGIPQLDEDVQPVAAPAERARRTAPESPRTASEILTLASQIDANSRAIAEIAAAAKKTARTTILIGIAAALIALCAIVMVAWRQVAPNTKQASVQAPAPRPPAIRPLPPALPPAETPQAPAPQEAQQVQPPEAPQINPPDLNPEGQSLADALALIADKAGGTVNFTAQFHDTATGRDHSEQLSYQASNVTIDPNRCQVGYHWRMEQDGRTVSDQDRTIDLRLAKNIKVTSIDAEAGRRFLVRATPKVHIVHIARWDNASGDNLYFRDRSTAARVGAATRHAAQLCGNGERQFPRR